MDEITAILALTFLKGLSQANALEACRRYGSAQAVVAGPADAPEKLSAALQNLPAAQAQAERELQFCERSAVRVLPYTDAAYPERLRHCPDAPLALFYRGTAHLNAPRVLSVVGTRHITEYGKDLCRHLTADLAQMFPDVVVVSGLAYGVDIHAHRGALREGLPTIGVLAHGFDRIYPAVHRSDAAAMLRHGGLLTEYPSGTIPERGNFVRRNRIVAGVSDATIVVESAEKGGALITARLAADYHRDVFAFPGRTTDKYSAGCNRLILRNEAQLVTCAADVAEALLWPIPKAVDAPIQRELFPELSAEEKLVVSALPDGESRTISQLAAVAQLPFSRLSALLVGLELKGVLKGMPGGLYRKLG